MSDIREGWQFWIDRGGTFTDIVAVSPQGHLAALKLLSVAPGLYNDAAIAGIRRSGPRVDAPIRPTASLGRPAPVATNALERKGDPVVLVI